MNVYCQSFETVHESMKLRWHQFVDELTTAELDHRLHPEKFSWMKFRTGVRFPSDPPKTKEYRKVLFSYLVDNWRNRTPIATAVKTTVRWTVVRWELWELCSNKRKNVVLRSIPLGSTKNRKYRRKSVLFIFVDKLKESNPDSRCRQENSPVDYF